MNARNFSGTLATLWLFMSLLTYASRMYTSFASRKNQDIPDFIGVKSVSRVLRIKLCCSPFIHCDAYSVHPDNSEDNTESDADVGPVEPPSPSTGTAVMNSVD